MSFCSEFPLLLFFCVTAVMAEPSLSATGMLCIAVVCSDSDLALHELTGSTKLTAYSPCSEMLLFGVVIIESLPPGIGAAVSAAEILYNIVVVCSDYKLAILQQVLMMYCL